jgi:hypothetical protein
MTNRNRVCPRVEELERRLAPASHGFSTNWAGYAVNAHAGAVTRVAGEWVVPAVASNVSGYSSAWVGMDGWSSNTVEQIGTDSDFTNGHAHYYAWYEMYPAGSVNLSMTISPGDHMSASVTYTGASQFALSITNVTTGSSFVTTQTSSEAQLSSAEWIQEAPSSFAGVLPLANFGTINFSGANATVDGATGPADNSWSGTTLLQIDMVNHNGSLKASTSTLTDSGSPSTSAFSVTFVSSGQGGKGGGRKSPNLSPSQLNTLVAGNATTIAAAAVASTAPTFQVLSPSVAAGPILESRAVPITVSIITSTKAPAPASLDGSDIIAKVTESMYPPAAPAPSEAVPANPATTPPADAQADPKGDKAPNSPQAPAGPGPAAPVTIDVVRLASDLLEGTDSIFASNHEGQGFALGALVLTLALERGWMHAVERRSGKRPVVRDRSGTDPDDRQFQPKATNVNS